MASGMFLRSVPINVTQPHPLPRPFLCPSRCSRHLPPPAPDCRWCRRQPSPRVSLRFGKPEPGFPCLAATPTLIMLSWLFQPNIAPPFVFVAAHHIHLDALALQLLHGFPRMGFRLSRSSSESESERVKSTFCWVPSAFPSCRWPSRPIFRMFSSAVASLIRMFLCGLYLSPPSGRLA